MKFIKATF